MESTLWTLRRRIERLASPDGGYRVVSVGSGSSPVPVNGLQFPSRSAAAMAVLLARSYRRTLRDWDPRTPTHELTVETNSVTPDWTVARLSQTSAARSEQSL